MTMPNVSSERFRILLACARPVAARTVKLKVKLVAGNAQQLSETRAAVTSFLEEKMMLAVLHEESDAENVTFELSAPLPDVRHLASEVRNYTGVLSVSHSDGSRVVDFRQPGEELEAILNGLNSLNSSVEITLLDHADPLVLRAHLETAPGFDALILCCHGNRSGTLLLDDGRGWARYVRPRELAEIVGGKVKVLFISASHGERSLRALFELEEGQRPSTIIFSEGEYPIQSRAAHIFIEGFCSALAQGEVAAAAFQKGVDRVRGDDQIGEVACPDGMLADGGPSPFRRFQINERQAQAFPGMPEGIVEVLDPGHPAPPHCRIIRAGEFVMGREIITALLIDELLPPIGGMRQAKSRLVHLHGEGGIGKTHLAQTVCDALEDYRHFPGGIYELDCGNVPDPRQLAAAILKGVGPDEVEKLLDPDAGLIDALNRICSSAGDILLMLDNVDPFFSGGGGEETAWLLKKIISECPRVRILSTCRTQLGLGDFEADFLADPLDSEPAADLFLHSIPDHDIQAQVRSLPAKDKQHLSSLAGALQGHPLSIFLAAHRIAAGADRIVPQLIHARESFLEFLDTPELRGVPARQKSLHASLDLSYNLLSESGKEFFRKSSQFPGGLYRGYSTLDVLLGEKWRECAQEAAGIGLIRFDRDTQRYWMLNPVREYAERLLDGAEGNTFRIEVAEHWARFTDIQDFLLNPAQNPERLAELNLPPDVLERQVRLERLRNNAFAVMKVEETNILFSYRWSLENHVKAAEEIATKMMDYLSMCGKRRTNAWMAGAVLNTCKDDNLRSKWLNNLGAMLSEMGDTQGALKAAEESLDLYRKLADKHPEAFLPYVAMTLNNLGAMLSKMGDRQGALKATEESLDLYRKLAEKHLEAFLPHVAISLRNLGAMLSGMGDGPGALKATEEALDLYRKLAEKQPDAFMPDVAGTLNHLVNRLSEVGDGQGALKATEESLDLYRKLAEKHPEAFLPYVAGMLNSLGNRLSEMGDGPGALRATEESVDLYRKSAEKHPDAFLPYVAGTLNSLSNRLSESGKEPEALKATEESLELYRKLAEKHPDAFLPYVAGTLNDFGKRLLGIGDGPEALRVTEEALGLYHKLAEKQPGAFLSHVAMTLNNLGNMLAETGDGPGAIAATEKSLYLYRKLAEQQPEAFLPDVGMTLNNLGSTLSETGDKQGALDCFRENLIVARRASHLTGNVALAVQALARAAQFLSETSPNAESLELYEEAANIIRPAAEEHCGALLYLIEINEMRVELMGQLDPPKAQQISAELEKQKAAYLEKCKVS
ncbi:MAG: tetratricopeptide repeat protein [Syntrophobacteraceae bacterium]